MEEVVGEEFLRVLEVELVGVQIRSKGQQAQEDLELERVSIAGI